MSDPLGLISTSAGIQRQTIDLHDMARGGTQLQGPTFKELLTGEIEKVNDLQRDAQRALEDLATGNRDDVEGVLLATQKADTAFKLLLQVRNKVMDAYDEVKQIRV